MKKNSKIDPNLICVGSVGKSKGLKGEFRLNSYCLPKENILTYSKLKIEGYDPHSIEYIKSEKNHFIAKLKEINDCLLYTSPSPRDYAASRMPSSA